MVGETAGSEGGERCRVGWAELAKPNTATLAILKTNGSPWAVVLGFISFSPTYTLVELGGNTGWLKQLWAQQQTAGEGNATV